MNLSMNCQQEVTSYCSTLKILKIAFFIETGGAGIPLLIEMERKFDKTPNNAIVG